MNIKIGPSIIQSFNYSVWPEKNCENWIFCFSVFTKKPIKCFSICCLKGKRQISKETKSQVKFTFFFSFIFFSYFFSVPHFHRSWAVYTGGHKCRYRYLTEQGGGTSGRTAMHVSSNMFFGSDAQNGGHDGGENFRNISASVFFRTSHTITWRKKAWCRCKMSR